MSIDVQPYRIDVDPTVIADLKDRLGRARFADDPGAGWDYGVDGTYLRELCEYWRDEYDWYAQQERLNAQPQFMATVDGVRMHFTHFRGKGPNPVPMVPIHGWPSSYPEMTKLAEHLSDPAAHGADPADSFDVIVPSLPGFAFSGPQPTGYGYHQAAADIHRLMTEALGYERFSVHSTGLGPFVTGWIAYEHPEAILGYHTHDPLSFPTATAQNVGEWAGALAERQQRSMAWARAEGAYAEVQRTKPQSIGHALNDSPMGLAGWLLDKHRTWSDCHGDLESRYTKEELCTGFTIYWVTGTITSSMRAYYERQRRDPAIPTTPLQVPCGVAMPRYDPNFPPRWTPRGLAEQLHDVRHWVDLPAGGHFASWEEPALVADSIRAFHRPLRS